MFKRILKDEDLYIKDSKTVRSVIRKRIIKDKLIPYICAICNSLPEWRGEDMSLILDHENGINNDHRLENLRFLCPNCNHQQPTYAGKNKKRRVDKICLDCEKVIHPSSKRCNSCAQKKKHKEGLLKK